MFRKLFCSCALAAAVAVCPVKQTLAADLSPRELQPVLEQLLKEHPEVILSFLKEHCEELLDIAQQGSNSRRLASLEKQWKEDAKVPKKIALDSRPTAGNPNAKVRIVAFSDFTCQYCRRAESTVEALLKEYEGKVSFVFKNLPLDPKGTSGLASEYFIAVSMESEELAWKFYKALFQNGDALTSEGESFLRKTAQEIGADMRKLDKNRKLRQVKEIIKEDQKDADALHIEGTPCFLVNNLVVRGAIPKEMFRRAIEIELNAVR